MLDLNRNSAPTSTLDRVLTEEIANATHTDTEVVQATYQQQLSELAEEARITQFLGVLAVRRVKQLLTKN